MRTQTAPNFDKVKVQVIELLSKNQRASALAIIEKELLRDDKDYKNKLMVLKFNMLNDFLTLSAQEAFEISAGTILSDRKKAQNFMQQCLTLEPENLQCQWLELKYLRKYNFGSFVEKAKIYLETIQNFKQMNEIKNSLLISLGREVESPSKKKDNLTKPMEQDLLENMINYQMALQSESFFQAKQILNYLTLHYSDYPELIFMSYQLSTLWPEGVGFSESVLDKQFEMYRKKCADLPVSVARKYFFDISLCTRSLK